MVYKSNIKICSRCIYDERVAEITFDLEGICNYCKQIDDLKLEYGTGQELGKEKLDAIVQKIKKDGKNKKYDCIIGVSGGTDSSYLLLLSKKMGLRPLAVHYDNTWNSAIASQNMGKVLNSLDIDLYTHVIDNKEADDIFKSFFIAGVAEIEASTDLAIAEVMYRAASKYGIKYIFEGHSFVTEGITPLGRNYFDGKYVSSIHKLYGKRPMNTYPLMTFLRFLWWVCILRIKKIRPFWYLDYNKEEARKLLEKKFDWKYYGGHHLENRMTAFFHSIYAPQKFDSDFRNNSLSARVRNGYMSRNEAMNDYNSPPYIEDDLLEYFKKRLKLSNQEYEKIMKSKPKSWSEFPNYKKLFEFFKPLFYLFYKYNLVPKSFYMKYCFPLKNN